MSQKLISTMLSGKVVYSDSAGGSATERVGQGYGQRISVKALLQMVENAINWFRKYYAVIQNLSALNLRGR